MLAKDRLTKCAGGSFSLRTTKTKYTIISQKEVSLIFVVFVIIMKSFINISEHKNQFIKKKLKIQNYTMNMIKKILILLLVHQV